MEMYIYLDDTTRIREPLKNYKELHESMAVQHYYYKQSWGPFLGALTEPPVAVSTGRTPSGSSPGGLSLPTPQLFSNCSIKKANG